MRACSYGAFPGIETQWQQIVVFLAIASMLLGAFAAIGQTNIKRLMAYSSIGHVGFALVGARGRQTKPGMQGVLIYLAIYLVMTLGSFACILTMRREGGHGGGHQRAWRACRNQPGVAFVLAMLLFSLAGVPPLAGFFAKFYVFAAAVKAGLYPLAIIGVLSSVVGALLLSPHRQAHVLRRSQAEIQRRRALYAGGGCGGGPVRGFLCRLSVVPDRCCHRSRAIVAPLIFQPSPASGLIFP